MKQIIVNVSGLTIEEKQRVNEALAEITGATKLPTFNPKAGWFLAPESLDSMRVTWDWLLPCGEPTHTPQQALEMAGMETSTDQHVFSADKFIITDSSGRIVYDGTLESISTFINPHTNAGPLPSSGFSVKTDENGVAVMTTDRKVRKDFDPKQTISVDVSNCTEDKKKEVQQAFFDVGIKWKSGMTGFDYLNARLYTNSTAEGTCSEQLMYGTVPRTDSISHKQFLELVYEPEQQGHVHAENMALYAEDAKTTDKPWELWQFKNRVSNWVDIPCSPVWDSDVKYRRKPKTHTVHGVEVPDISFTPEDNEYYFYPDPTLPCMYEMEYFHNYAEECGHRLTNKMCYPTTDEGREAAILHAKIMLGVQP